MSLQPIKDTATGVIPVFSKILECIVGGVSLVVSNLADGVTLPKGAMLDVNEMTRQGTAVKSARFVRAGTGTGATLTNHLVADGHLFQVGDYVGAALNDVGRGARAITAIVATTIDGDSAWKLTVPTGGTATGIGTGYAKGGILFETATGADHSVSELKNYPNYLLRDSVVAKAGAFVNAVLRGTAYGRRMQPHLDEHLTKLKHIHVSDSQ